MCIVRVNHWEVMSQINKQTLNGPTLLKRKKNKIIKTVKKIEKKIEKKCESEVVCIHEVQDLK